MSDSNEVLIEWIPNVSTGDQAIVDEIRNLFYKIPNLYLIHTDRSLEVNRTVFTLVGTPASLRSAIMTLLQFLNEHVNMQNHIGSHPRLGALDVSPYVPLQNGSLLNLKRWVRDMAREISHKFNLPVYLYEHSASRPDRRNLADIRRGEYEGHLTKIQDPDWIPDFGTRFNPGMGATVMGLRDFLIAYNVNLDTKDLIKAKRIARDIRSKGRPDRRNHLPGLKAIGWYLRDSKFCQVSTNITQTRTTTPLDVYDRCSKIANTYNSRVTGSEIIGLIPYHCLNAMLVDSPYSSTTLAQYLGLHYCGIQDLKDRIIEHKVYIASGKSLFNELFEKS